MPTRRRFVRRRPRRKRYTNRTKRMVTGKGPSFLENLASGIGSAAKVASAVLPLISAINTEEKYFDVSQNGDAYLPGTNDVIVPLTEAIPRGDTDSDRIGTSILARDLNIRIITNSQINTPVSSNMGHIVRLTLLCWKANATENPITIVKVYADQNDISSAFNKDYTDQFVIMKDKIFASNGTLQPWHIPVTTPEPLTQFQSGYSFNKFFRKLQWHIRWATGDDPTTNHIYLIVRSTGGQGNTGTSFLLYSRLNYTDN